VYSLPGGRYGRYADLALVGASPAVVGSPSVTDWGVSERDMAVAEPAKLTWRSSLGGSREMRVGAAAGNEHSCASGVLLGGQRLVCHVDEGSSHMQLNVVVAASCGRVCRRPVGWVCSESPAAGCNTGC
jgi:hypothetical protein